MIFKDFIREELSHIPSFIDCKDEIHLEIYHIMGEINETILELVSQKVLTKNKVYGIAKRFKEYTDFCMIHLDKIAKIEFSVYYTAVLEWVEEESVKEEYFETAANVKLFDDIYFKKC